MYYFFFVKTFPSISSNLQGVNWLVYNYICMQEYIFKVKSEWRLKFTRTERRRWSNDAANSGKLESLCLINIDSVLSRHVSGEEVTKALRRGLDQPRQLRATSFVRLGRTTTVSDLNVRETVCHVQQIRHAVWFTRRSWRRRWTHLCWHVSG